MILECPKCKTSFTIFDSIEKLRQTCSREGCKALIDIKRLERNEQYKVSVYEITEVTEEKKTLAPNLYADVE